MTARFPDSESQLRHIFRLDEGHVRDTPSNRALLLWVANDERNFLVQNPYGARWYSRLEPDGTQTWVVVRHGIIINGGVNVIPLPLGITGLRRR